jgi:hypothetical protein
MDTAAKTEIFAREHPKMKRFLQWTSPRAATTAVDRHQAFGNGATPIRGVDHRQNGVERLDRD